MSVFVQGHCPACGQQTLGVGAGRYILCNNPDCPAQDALAAILDDNEIHHLVTFREDDFVVKHPLIERAGNTLFDCEYFAAVAAWKRMWGPGSNNPGNVTPGSTWRLILSAEDAPVWERIDKETN